MKENKFWAIIPARGGSKGVLKKNTKDFCGSSLLERSIKSLNDSECFNKIIVSSDEKEILELAISCGAEAHNRSEAVESLDHIMTDVPVSALLKSTLKADRPNFSFMIQCTAPFISSDRYIEACSLLEKNPKSTIFAATAAHQFLWEESENDNLSWNPINHPFHERVGRQFIKNIQVHETGAFYGFNTEDFINSGYRFHTKAIPLMTSKIEAIDINDEDDWNYAEYINRTLR